MSSYLSKSKKAFKPKVPSSRPTGAGVASSAQSPIRGSADRHTQTPQPPHKLPTPSAETLAAESVSDAHERVPPAAEHDGRERTEEPLPVQPRAVLGHGQVDHQRIASIADSQPSEPSAHLSQILAAAHSGQEQDEVHNGETLELPSQLEGLASTRTVSTAQQPVQADVFLTPPNIIPTLLTSHAQDNQQLTPGVSSQERLDNDLDVFRGNTAALQTRQAERALALPETPDLQYSSEQPLRQNDHTQVHNHATNSRTDIEYLADVIVNAAAGEDEEPTQSAAKHRAKRQKRKREATPEEFELNKIAPTVVTMTEITRDTRLGKKSNRERRLQERDREAARKKLEDSQEQARRQAEGFMEDPTLDPNSGPSASSNAAAAEAASALTQGPPSPRPMLAPRVRLVNGQIVQDEESRLVDRHAAATAHAAGTSRGGGNNDDEDADAVSEDELTRRINSGSYMRRERHTKWTESETDTFLDGLRMFGTDFMTISKLFPGRTRRQIKLKFNKEERSNPDRIQRALLTERRAPSIAEFERLAGVTLRSKEQHINDLKNDHDRLVKEQEEESAAMRKIQAEREEAARVEAESSVKKTSGTANVRKSEKAQRRGDGAQLKRGTTYHTPSEVEEEIVNDDSEEQEAGLEVPIDADEEQAMLDTDSEIEATQLAEDEPPVTTSGPTRRAAAGATRSTRSNADPRAEVVLQSLEGEQEQARHSVGRPQRTEKQRTRPVSGRLNRKMVKSM